MQNHSFYPDSPELITPELTISQQEKDLAGTVPLTSVILCYSRQLFQILLDENRIAAIDTKLTIGSAALKTPICMIPNQPVGIVLSGIGAPAAAAVVEEMRVLFPIRNVIAFGSCGALTELPEGKIIIPDNGYRDEGTSYHYAEAGDWIPFSNAAVLKQLFSSMQVETVTGNIWTTDAFYRETREEVNQRVNQGCIAVDMEATALQAVCNFRSMQLYQFLYSADSLHGDWQRRILGSMEKDSRIAMFQLAASIAQNL